MSSDPREPPALAGIQIVHPSWILWHVDGELREFPAAGMMIPAGSAVRYTESKTFDLEDLDETTMYLTCDQLPHRVAISIG